VKKEKATDAVGGLLTLTDDCWLLSRPAAANTNDD
jgi:hypothetical protein